MTLRDRILGILRHHTDLGHFERRSVAELIVLAVEIDQREKGKTS